MHVADLRRLSLFEGLGDDQLAELLALGSEVRFASGQQLFQEGQPAEFWWVLVEGTVDLVRHVGREETVLGVMDAPGRWAGGFRAWDDHGVYLATGRASRGSAGVDKHVVSVRSPPHRGAVQNGPELRDSNPPEGGSRCPGHARGRTGSRNQQPGRRGNTCGGRTRSHV